LNTTSGETSLPHTVSDRPSAADRHNRQRFFQ
jgi:hypothetical protein